MSLRAHVIAYLMQLEIHRELTARRNKAPMGLDQPMIYSRLASRLWVKTQLNIEHQRSNCTVLQSGIAGTSGRRPWNMRPTATFLRQCIRMTFFTRPNCSLCDEAKHVLSKVWDRKPFEYDEIDVMKQGQDKWKALYQFDTPVVSKFLILLLEKC